MSKMTRFYVYAVLSGMQFTFTTWLAYVSAHGGNPGWGEAAFHMAIVLGEVPTGIVADLLGRRTSMLVGLLLSVIQPFLYFTVHNTLTTCLVMALGGLTLTFFSGADTALIYETAQAEGGPEVARKTIARVQALQMIALAAAPAIAGLLYQWHDWAPFIARVGVGLVTGVIVWGMKETRPAAAEGEHRSAWAQTRAAIGIVRGNRVVLRLIVFACWYNTAFSLTGQYGQTYFPYIGLVMGVAGFVFAAGHMLSSVGGWLAGHMHSATSERSLRYAPLGVGLAIAAMGFGLPAVGVVCYALLGLVDGVLWPTWMHRFNEQIPSAQRATLLSFQSMGVSVLMSAAFPAASYLNPVTRIYTVTGLTALALAVLWATTGYRRSTSTQASP